MEISNFFRLLLRHKLTLILVPLLTVAATYFLVRSLPDVYRSRARLSTGIADQADAARSVNSRQESEINQEFNNIIQTITLKKILNQVSYQLILHDLTAAQPFRRKSSGLASMNEAQKNEAIRVFTEKYQRKEDLMPDKSGESRMSIILESMKYDYEALQKKLSVYRINNSDFIDLQFDSEDPELSAFVLNTLCREFIGYHTTMVKENNTMAVAYLDSLVRKKQDSLHKKTIAVRNYKIQNGILNVDDQASTLIRQIAEFETKKQEAQKDISSYAGALKNIDSKFDPKDRQYLESFSTKINQDIIATRTRLNRLNNDYIGSNFDPRYKSSIDSLQNALSSQISQTNDIAATNPMANKKSLVDERLNLEVSLQLAQNSVSSLDGALGQLNSKLYSLVPNQAVLQSLQEEIVANTNELAELTKKLNDASMQASFTVKLRQVETAMPGKLQASKKMLLVLLAGIISFALCVAVLFVMFLADGSVKDSRQLANKTGMPVIGSLNLLPGKVIDLDEVWSRHNDSESIKLFKSQLRSVRFELNNLPDNPSVFAVTSLQNGAGKTFFAMNLAYTYGMINKKVLLIDGNFENPQISKMSRSGLYLKDHLSNEENDMLPALKSNITVLGNKGEDISLSEINDYEMLHDKMQMLKERFDIIIMETPSMETGNKAKEWFPLADKVIAVFEAGQTISESKKENVSYLQTLGNKVVGWVLNKSIIKVKETKTSKKKQETPIWFTQRTDEVA